MYEKPLIFFQFKIKCTYFIKNNYVNNIHYIRYKYICLMYEVSRLIWYIICVVIIINKEIVEVNVLKSHTLKISAKINYVKPGQKIT